MANYKEVVCGDAARNYICLQTALRSKHMPPEEEKKNTFRDEVHSKEPKVPSKHHVTVENAWAMTNMRTGLVIFYSKNCLPEQNWEIVDESLWREATYGVYLIQYTPFLLLLLLLFSSPSGFSPAVLNQMWHFPKKHKNVAPHSQHGTPWIHKWHMDKNMQLLALWYLSLYTYITKSSESS